MHVPVIKTMISEIIVLCYGVDMIPALAGFQRVHRLGDFIMSVTPSPHENHSAPIQNANDLGGLECFWQLKLLKMKFLMS